MSHRFKTSLFFALLALALPLSADVITNAAELVRAVRQGRRGACFHLRGTIVDIAPAKAWYYILESDGQFIIACLEGFDKKAGLLHNGDLVDVKGDIAPRDTGYAASAISRQETILAHGPEFPYVPATIRQILDHKPTSPRVLVRGLVSKFFRDPLDPDQIFFELTDAGASIYVGTKKKREPGENLRDLTGCRVAVRGIWLNAASMRVTSYPLHIDLHRLDTVEILSTPSWWTRERLGWTVLTLVVALVLLLAWMLVMRALSHARLGERTRLATELHDHLSQSLTAISYHLSAARKAQADHPADVDETLDLAERMMASCRTEMRRCLWDLRNNALDCDRLGDGIRTSIAPLLNNVPCTVNVDIPRRMFSDTAAHDILSVVRELVANALRHGNCSRITVSGVVMKKPGAPAALILTVRDNGCGFQPNLARGLEDGHLGLAGIQERVKRNRGQIRLKSAPGEGTVVTIRLEIDRNER